MKNGGRVTRPTAVQLRRRRAEEPTTETPHERYPKRVAQIETKRNPLRYEP